MNAERRKEIAKASALIGEARAILEQVATDEREAFDNMPDSLKQSERGQQAEAAADALDEAVNACEEIDGKLEEATQ